MSQFRVAVVDVCLVFILISKNVGDVDLCLKVSHHSTDASPTAFVKVHKQNGRARGKWK